MSNHTNYAIRPLVPPVIVALALVVLVSATAQAQAQTKELFACYAPNSGVVYRVNDPNSPGAEPSLKDDCTGKKHVKFSWAALAVANGKVGSFDVDGTVGASAFASASPLIFEAPAGTERMGIDDITGNVGIGTPSPAAKLHVGDHQLLGYVFDDFDRAGAAIVSSNKPAPSLTVLGPTDNGGFLRLGDIESGIIIEMRGDIGGDPYIDVKTHKALVFKQRGSERMRLDGNGNVGIGTVSPSDKLEVSGGNIRVTGGSFIDDGTTLAVPDYVFEEDYPLMSLDELRAYIARDKHLPNVPSAEDIKKDGLNLSQFQMRLLEKIEELTLYILAQQKRTKALELQVKGLAGRAHK